ncbi:MAG: hypothetical protein LBD15_00335 [Holosporales bacterium]|nr:hypothetical protein [Holosporales bacterium]
MRYNTDQYYYVGGADHIVNGHCALFYRLPGPALMVIVSRFLFGEDHWIVGIALFNLSMLGIASVFLYRLMRDLAWPCWIRTAVLFSYSTGIFGMCSRIVSSRLVFYSCALIAISVLCRMCLGNHTSRADRIACFASLFTMPIFRETAICFALTLLPLFFVLYKRLRTKVFSVCFSCTLAVAIPTGVFYMLSWYSVGVPVLSTSEGRCFGYAVADASRVHPEFVQETWLKELYPNGGHLSNENVNAAFSKIVEKRAETLALKDPSKQHKAWAICNAQLGKEAKRDFFRLMVSHPIEWLKMAPWGYYLHSISLHGPLYCFDAVSGEAGVSLPSGTNCYTSSGLPKRYAGHSQGIIPLYTIGSSRIASFVANFLCFYGMFLSVLGALYALWGVFAPFQKYAEEKKEKLMRVALLCVSLSFLLGHALLLFKDAYYIMHATFLSGFLGWWAIADFVKKRRKCCMA